jgi:hypothetical protein
VRVLDSEISRSDLIIYADQSRALQATIRDSFGRKLFLSPLKLSDDRK